MSALRVSDRESLDRALADFGHERSDRAGINPATEKESERHVAYQVTLDRLLQLLSITPDVAGCRPIRLRVRSSRLETSCPRRAQVRPNSCGIGGTIVYAQLGAQPDFILKFPVYSKRAKTFLRDET